MRECLTILVTTIVNFTGHDSAMWGLIPTRGWLERGGPLCWRSMKTLLIVGATGLVGRAVLRLAPADTAIGRVVAPTRRALEVRHGKLVNPVVDFDTLPAGSD